MTARSALLLLWFCLAGSGCTSPGAEAEWTAPSFPGGVLRSPDGLLHNPELQAVVEAGLRRDVDALLRHLEAVDPRVRARAAYALASVASPRTRDPLEAHLDDPDPRVREDAAFAVGQIKDARSAPVLLDALARESEPRVRNLLLEALGKCGDSAALDRLLELPLGEGDREGLAVALGAFGRRGMGNAPGGRRLLALLATGDARIVELAALALAAPRSGDPWEVDDARLRDALSALPRESPAAVPLLVALRPATDSLTVQTALAWLEPGGLWRTRVAAARALGGAAERGDVRAALFRALDDPSIHVAVTAAQVLAGTGAPRPEETDAWISWIRENGARWRVGAALLPTLATAGAGDFVLEWARNPRAPGVPAWAGYAALGRLERPEALERLLEGLASEDRRRNYVAAGALARRMSARPLADGAVARIIETVASRLPAWGPHAPSSDVRGLVQLLEALDRRAGPRAMVLLRKAAEHGHPRIRESAQRLLGLEPGEDAERSAPRIDWASLAAVGPHPRIHVETSRGDFVLELDTEAAPLSVQTFIRFVREGRYADLPFHRVEADFILQSGDFDHEAGFGGPAGGIVSEFSRIPYRRGTLGMASAGRDTEGSQYFITHGPSPSLNGRYTAFGWVVDGMAVADRIARMDRVLAVRVE